MSGRRTTPAGARDQGLAAAVGLALLLLLPGCSRRGGEFGRIQSSLIAASGCEWDRQIRLGIPSCLFGLARLGFSLVELEPEARAALETVRGVRLALYQLADGAPDRRRMFEAADRALAGEGWQRVVGAFTGNELVLVYVPADLKPGHDLELCAVVFDGRQLTFVAGRANPGPLTAVALEHVAREEHRLRRESRL